MKYLELIKNVDKFEEEYELTECMYFGAIEKLEEVQKDLEKLDDVQHIERVIKLFLIQWGNMNRVVGREGLDWKGLRETLCSLENDFDVLRNKKFLAIDFDGPEISDVVIKMYEKLDPLQYLGSPTTISKILHLLNPEVFVMWDNTIVKGYHKINRGVNYTSRGYLEFLKATQKEIKEALNERQKETGKRLDEIENEIRLKYKNKTLAKIIDEYNWITRPVE